ncbi:MAG: carboxymuconolactone decarboxylase family protein [Armatimonadetes bacterium]|nr:carboxymuconolactone decarboxylase family protein [Armatimonadota bacterium]
MAWIRTIKPREATGNVLVFYEEVRASLHTRQRLAGQPLTDLPDNPVPNVLMSLHPAAARAFLKFRDIVMAGESPLSRAQREMIATVVSAANRCVF